MRLSLWYVMYSYVMSKEEETYLQETVLYINVLGRKSTSVSECWGVPTLIRTRKMRLFAWYKNNSSLKPLRKCTESSCCYRRRSGRRSDHDGRIFSSTRRYFHYSLISYLFTHPSRFNFSRFVSISFYNALYSLSLVIVSAGFLSSLI